MSDSFEQETRGKRKQVGINHPDFRPRKADGTFNGHSQRKNKARKKARYLRNVSIRAALYAQFHRKSTGVGEFHTTLDALSKGTAG